MFNIYEGWSWKSLADLCELAANGKLFVPLVNLITSGQVGKVTAAKPASLSCAHSVIFLMVTIPANAAVLCFFQATRTG